MGKQQVASPNVASELMAHGHVSKINRSNTFGSTTVPLPLQGWATQQMRDARNPLGS
jgi:hypothetical protein